MRSKFERELEAALRLRLETLDERFTRLIQETAAVQGAMSEIKSILSGLGPQDRPAGDAAGNAKDGSETGVSQEV